MQIIRMHSNYAGLEGLVGAKERFNEEALVEAIREVWRGYEAFTTNGRKSRTIRDFNNLYCCSYMVSKICEQKKIKPQWDLEVHRELMLRYWNNPLDPTDLDLLRFGTEEVARLLFFFLETSTRNFFIQLQTSCIRQINKENIEIWPKNYLTSTSDTAGKGNARQGSTAGRSSRQSQPSKVDKSGSPSATQKSSSINLSFSWEILRPKNLPR